jgi:hypothetical protein
VTRGERSLIEEANTGPGHNPIHVRSPMRTDLRSKIRPKKEIKGPKLEVDAIPDVLQVCPSGYGFLYARTFDFRTKKKVPSSLVRVMPPLEHPLQYLLSESESSTRIQIFHSSLCFLKGALFAIVY